jgi:hypothetical protein
MKINFYSLMKYFLTLWSTIRQKLWEHKEKNTEIKSANFDSKFITKTVKWCKNVVLIFGIGMSQLIRIVSF